MDKMYKRYGIIQGAMFFVMLITGSLADFDEPFMIGSYIMLTFLWVSTLVSILFGRIQGMLFSIIIVLIYAAFVFYQGMLGIDTIIPMNYVWIISFPLLSFLAGYIGESIQEILEKYNKYKDLQDMLVTKDELTGLGNAKEFYQNLKVEMSLARRHKRDITIVIIEVQYFDELLAIYGKGSYTRIFDVITSILKKITRTEDTIYRISEKTFALLLPQTPLEGAEVVKRKIKDGLSEINTYTDKRFEEMHIEVRVGLASLDDSIKSEFEFKKKAEKEVEFDV